MSLSEETRFLIDFNVQDVAVALGIDIPTAAGASILGTHQAEMTDYIRDVDAAVAKTASELSEHPAVAAMTAALSKHNRVMAIGDSITTYRYSYARLMAHLLPQSEFINHGYSGYTSSHGLELTHTRFVQLQPDAVFIKYGVNDGKRFGGADGRTLVSGDEYRGNLSGIIRAFQQYTDAEITLLSPTPVIEAAVSANEDFKAQHMAWQNSDLSHFAAIAREVSETFSTHFVDLYELFTSQPDPKYYLEDALHPNALGQQHILKAIAKSYL